MIKIVPCHSCLLERWKKTFFKEKNTNQRSFYPHYGSAIRFQKNIFCQMTPSCSPGWYSFAWNPFLYYSEKYLEYDKFTEISYQPYILFKQTNKCLRQINFKIIIVQLSGHSSYSRYFLLWCTKGFQEKDDHPVEHDWVIRSQKFFEIWYLNHSEDRKVRVCIYIQQKRLAPTALMSTPVWIWRFWLCSIVCSTVES